MRFIDSLGIPQQANQTLKYCKVCKARFSKNRHSIELAVALAHVVEAVSYLEILDACLHRLQTLDASFRGGTACSEA